MVSVLGGIFWKPFPGDFELTEVGVAIAAFAFLPYCQLTDANVTADIFTARASHAGSPHSGWSASLVALGFAVLLLWRMYRGMGDQREYGYTTAILQLPIWWAFVPILISLALLALAALVTLRRIGRRRPLRNARSNDRCDFAGPDGLVVLVALIALRMPIAYAMILVGGVGIALLNGPALFSASSRRWPTASSRSTICPSCRCSS